MTTKLSVLARAGLGIALAMSSATAAFAQAAGGGTGNSIGEKLQQALNSSSGPLFIGIAAVGWIAGLYLFFSGLHKLSQASESGGRGDGAGSGMIRLAMGIMLFALPDIAGIGMQSMFGVGVSNIFGGASELAQISQQLDLETGSGSGAMSAGNSLLSQAIGNAGTPQTPDDCYAAATGITCMAKNIAKNAIPMGIYAIYTICFLAGLAMFASCLWTASKAYGQSSQGLPPGFWTKAAVALLLINSPLLIMTFATTLQGQGGVLTIQGFDAGSNFLSYSFQQTQQASNTSAQLQKFAELIGYVMVILAFFGVWAFFKGIFMVKATAEGKSQGTMGGGFVFMVGGVLLANAKISTCMILYTFGGTGMTFGFCGT
jgi:hypothetical protein